MFGLAPPAWASAENRSAVEVTAAIGDGTRGIDAGTITLMAHDESAIDAPVNARRGVGFVRGQRVCGLRRRRRGGERYR